jgi:hypothetical protein
MGGEGVRGYNMINMKITELRTALSRIFSKIRISAGCSLYNINFAERDSEAAMAGGGGGKDYSFRLKRCSVRIYRSSVGCIKAQYREQRSLEWCDG